MPMCAGVAARSQFARTDLNEVGPVTSLAFHSTVICVKSLRKAARNIGLVESVRFKIFSRLACGCIKAEVLRLKQYLKTFDELHKIIPRLLQTSVFFFQKYCTPVFQHISLSPPPEDDYLGC